MSKKLKATFKSDAADGGFSLPVAMGTGLVILMVGALLIARSMQSQAISIGRSRTSNSLAVTEAGVARTLAQFSNSNNAVLLTRNYDTINPNTGKTYLGSDGIANNGDEESAAVDEWTNFSSGTSSCSASGSNTASPNVSYTGTVGTDGQYTLQAYRYNKAAQSGTFLVAGQQGTSNSSKSYVLVTVALKPNSNSFDLLPGLWISWNPKSGASGSSSLQTNIQDSTCTSDIDANRVNQLQTHQAPIPPNGTGVTYNLTPGRPFPPLPAEGLNPLPGAYNKDPAGIVLSGSGDILTLPRPGETATSGILAYNIGQSGAKSINLKGGSRLNIGTGNETVILYLEGGMTISGSTLAVAPGTKLIIYARGNVSLSGSSGANAIGNSSNAANVQLYVYSPDNVTLSGSSGMRMFLFAPDSEVSFSSTANLQGTIWAKSWSGSGDALLVEQPIDLNQTKLKSLSSDSRISSITSWQRRRVP